VIERPSQLTDPFRLSQRASDLSIELELKQREPSKIRWRLADFCEAVIEANRPEATRLAKTAETRWQAESAAGSDHKSTTSAVSSATSRPPDRKDQQHERVTTPLKFEKPARWGFLFAWFLTAFFSTPE
jgi:hypothetical protein